MTSPPWPLASEPPPGVHLRRRKRVFQRLGDDVLLLPSAPVLHRSRDTEHRYHPDPELFYLTGLAEPGAVALLRGFADEDRFVLFVRPRDPEAERWTGPRAEPGRVKERMGADAVHPLDELEDRLPELLKGADRIHYRLDGRDSRTRRLVIGALERARARGARKGRGPRAVVDPGVLLDDLRLRKDDHELARIRKAAELTVAGFRRALPGAAPGVGEWEVESAFEAAVRGAGADGPAFPTIVASGPNACVLHYVDNARVVEEGDLVLMDGGARVGLYSADVSRTVPASGRFTGPARDLYRVVLEAHRRGAEAVRPGATTVEVHSAAVTALVEGMVELGLLEGEPGELMEEEAYNAYFPHQTSHWLGLDVHDPGDYARKGEPRDLEPGMVLTLEPGLYVPGELDEGATDAARAFRGVGIRLEDDLQVTDEGHENLTAALPLETDAVEEWLREARGGSGGEAP